MVGGATVAVSTATLAVVRVVVNKRQVQPEYLCFKSQEVWAANLQWWFRNGLWCPVLLAMVAANGIAASAEVAFDRSSGLAHAGHASDT